MGRHLLQRALHQVSAEEGTGQPAALLRHCADRALLLLASTGQPSLLSPPPHAASASSSSPPPACRSFAIGATYFHDATVSVFSENCVYSNGWGVDLNIDLHRGGAHNNLLSNINTGFGTRAWDSGGNTIRGKYSAANNTWWNIAPQAAGGQLRLPPCQFGPMLRFVGNYLLPTTGDGWDGKWGSSDRRRSRALLADVGGGSGSGAMVEAAARRRVDPIDTTYRQFPNWCSSEDWFVENQAPGSQLEPADLHASMVARRLNSRK